MHYFLYLGLTTRHHDFPRPAWQLLFIRKLSSAVKTVKHYYFVFRYFFHFFLQQKHWVQSKRHRLWFSMKTCSCYSTKTHINSAILILKLNLTWWETYTKICVWCSTKTTFNVYVSQPQPVKLWLYPVKNNTIFFHNYRKNFFQFDNGILLQMCIIQTRTTNYANVLIRQFLYNVLQWSLIWSYFCLYCYIVIQVGQRLFS